MYVAVKGGERGDRQRAPAPGRGAARRPGGARAEPGADRAAARARGRSGDDRGLALRPRARRAGHQAGARRPDRGDLPAARLPDDAAAARREPAARHRRRWRCTAGSRRPSRTCRAARSSARRSTTRTGCSTSSWPSAGDPGSSRRRRIDAGARPRGPDASLPRVIDLLDREGLIERESRLRATAAGRRPHPRAADVPGRPRRAPAEPGARRRGLPARAGLRHPARLRPQPPVRGRDPAGRGGGRAGPGGARVPDRRSPRSR